jgi:predicted DNA binding CopG/RHH family protein
MSERSRFIKVRVSEAEYRELRQRADAQGITMSEHVRVTVTVAFPHPHGHFR